MTLSTTNIYSSAARSSSASDEGSEVESKLKKVITRSPIKQKALDFSFAIRDTKRNCQGFVSMTLDYQKSKEISQLLFEVRNIEDLAKALKSIFVDFTEFSTEDFHEALNFVPQTIIIASERESMIND